MNAPRGFPIEEYRSRLSRAQALMDRHELDALLLTTPPEFIYFAGFLTRFWQSPTRPWFLILPRQGQPIAVIPGIGEPLMAKTWVEDIRTWVAPDPNDDGVTLLAETLREVAPKGRIGLPDGHETHIRMPWASLREVENRIAPARLVGDAGLVRSLRMVKSTLEVAKIETACTIAGQAFARIGEIAGEGARISRVFSQFQALGFEEGADDVPYLAVGVGPDGYDDVISPPTDEPLGAGDVLMLDVGLVHDGYFCDFDRNWAIGSANDTLNDGYKRLIEACDAGFDAARPGATAADLFQAMDHIIAGKEQGNVGRLGHGLGLNLTEWPSLIPTDRTELVPGMVLTLEPCAPTRNGQMLVHEENIVITKSGARYLTQLATRELPIL